MSIKNKSLSIIIPVYNEEDYIGACLDAIAAQTVKPDEVIVVDNNSTDNTVEIAKRYPFVKVIKESRQGLYYSRNKGMAAAKGNLLGRIDADTQLDKDWIKNAKELFTDSEVKLATGPLGYYDMPFPKFNQKLEAFLLRVAIFGGYKFIFGSNMIIRKSDWTNIVGQLCNKPFLFEDIDLAIHLKKRGILPFYEPGLSGMVSARRLEDRPTDFMNYIGGHTRTMSYHNERALGAYFAKAGFATIYILTKPLHMVFDPINRRLSLDYYSNRSEPRPDPMKTAPKWED